MNQHEFEAGKSAYQAGDWLGAVAHLGQAKKAGEANGSIDHLLGNAYMKLGQFDNAADAYADALSDASYGKVGALGCNRGRALLAAGKYEAAVNALAAALRDASYATPYKAYLAMGFAYEKLGDVRNAGIAYRNAATDETNPNPSGALSSLGSCFMRMGRAVDAVETYRTALDFSTPLENQNEVYRDLGLAYVAANRMNEAVDAFAHATSDGTLVLNPEAQAAYDAARKAVAARDAKSSRPSETDALLAAAGYGSGYDPLDPTGESGELMPSPEDTGFFSISEEDIVAEDRKNRKVRRKHRRTGLKVFVTILVILILAAAGGVFAYYRGYGWPTQQDVVQSLFSAKASGEDVSKYVSPEVDSEQLKAIDNVVPSGSTIQISSCEQSMSESRAYVTATLSEGGEQDFVVTMVRDGISWKVSDVTTSYLSSNGAAAATTGGTANEGTVKTDDASTSASADAATDASDSASSVESVDEGGNE